MNEGGLVPFELTVQILINALIANPSKVSTSCLLTSRLLLSSYYIYYNNIVIVRTI